MMKITTLEELEEQIKDIYLHNAKSYELVTKSWFRVTIDLEYKYKFLRIYNHLASMWNHPISGKHFKGETLQDIFDEFSDFIKEEF